MRQLMEISESAAIGQIQELLRRPRTFIEEEFSPYFYRYFTRYSNPKRFGGYLDLCKYLFEVTKSKDATVLDLGCGFGLMGTILGLYGSREVVGYDLNEEKIKCFKKLLSHLIPEIKNVKPLLGDSSKIEYPDKHFDVIIANETLSHVRDMQESIQEAQRVLKPGGSFLIRDGNNSLFLLGRMRRRAFWRRMERGPVDPSWLRATDIALPYVAIRQRMILDKFPHMDSLKTDFLSRSTAGMVGEEIFKAVEEFEKNGKLTQKSVFRYRNPITGEYPEREINPCSLKGMLQKLGFAVSFVPHFYSESFDSLEAAAKRFLYWMEKYLSVAHLFLSPGFALLGIKRDNVLKGEENKNCQ